jgi:hypothetical protein
MPGTITSDQTTIEDAEVVADYLVLGTFASAQALNDDIKVQGANAINGRVSANTAWSLALTAAGLDLTVTDRHVWQWLRLITWPSADTKANGGLGISISSDVTPTLTGTTPSNGPTNSKTWYLGGSDTDTTTGWVCYCVDPNGTPDLTLGTPVMSSVDRVGMRCKVTGTVSNKTLNLHHDVVRYGTGLTIKDGTSGSPADFASIAAADALNANAWGVVTSQSGIFFVNGKLYFGTASQTAITYFKDIDKVLVYPNFPVANAFYELRLAGAASFITTFELGTLASGLTSGGCTIRGAGNAVWTLKCDAANTITHLYGCVFSQMRRGFLRSDSSMINCTVVGSGEIDTGGATITGCVFQDVKTAAPVSGTWALIVDSSTEMAAITDCSFINCNKAIKITATGTYSFDGLQFTGNTFDVENSSAGLVTINVVGGGNTPTVTDTGGGSHVVNSNVAVAVTPLTTGSEVRAYRVSDGVELDGTESSSGSSHTLNLPAGVAVNIVCLCYSPPKIPVRIENVSFSTDQNLNPFQKTDANFANP